MSVKVKDKIRDKDSKSKWLNALRDAETELRIAKARVSQMKRAISICRDKAQHNQPWP